MCEWILQSCFKGKSGKCETNCSSLQAGSHFFIFTPSGGDWDNLFEVVFYVIALLVILSQFCLMKGWFELGYKYPLVGKIIFSVRRILNIFLDSSQLGSAERWISLMPRCLVSSLTKHNETSCLQHESSGYGTFFWFFKWCLLHLWLNTACVIVTCKGM